MITSSFHLYVRGSHNIHVSFLPRVTLDARGFSRLQQRNTAKRQEKPLVQAAEFSENAGPMGCRFIFPESDFDPSNSIGSRNLSVLTSTLIGLATESSSNRFSILLSTLFPVATGHNRNAAAKSRKSRSWRQKKFNGFYSFFAYVRQNSTTEFGVQISNLRSYFHILYGTLNFWIWHQSTMGTKDADW